jgi:hypothetical protein
MLQVAVPVLGEGDATLEQIRPRNCSWEGSISRYYAEARI